MGSRLDKGGQGRGQHPGQPDEISAGTAFVRGGLVQVRPFLGVIFAWTSRLQPGGFHQVPMAVQIVLEFIKVEITRRPLSEPRPLPKKVGELFRVDAKAEGDLVVVGGWESFGGRAIGGGPVVLAETDTENGPVGLRQRRAVPRDS